MVESDSATDRRNLRSERRPRTRRNENSARTSLRPLRRASVTSRYTLCVVNELTKSPTAVVGESDSDSGEALGVIPSVHWGFFKYIASVTVCGPNDTVSFSFFRFQN